MHEILESLEEINLSSHEYCSLAGDTYYTAPEFRVYVPKLMAGIVYDRRKTWSEGVSSSIFENDPKCGITHNSSVTLQNYVTVPRFMDASFHYRADKNGYLHKGTRFMMQVMYGNPKDLYLERVL